MNRPEMNALAAELRAALDEVKAFFPDAKFTPLNACWIQDAHTVRIDVDVGEDHAQAFNDGNGIYTQLICKPSLDKLCRILKILQEP